MASSTHTEIVQTDSAALWGFLQDKGRWAQLVPGYLHHEILADHEMIWVFKGDFGIIEKAVKLQLHVKEMVEDKKVAFDITGLSDNINGDGYFAVLEMDDGSCHLTGNLNMKAGGFLASMINPVLEKFVPQTVEQHVKSMAREASRTAV